MTGSFWWDLVLRLAKTPPRGVRIRLGLLLAAVLRGVVRLAGTDAVRAHWPGFAAVTGLHRPTR